MTAEIYSGTVDWNLIYRCFHSPEDIATRIQNYFPNHNSEILFAGFPETASLLCEYGYSIKFLEFSPQMAHIAQTAFPNLSVQTGDILEILKHDKSIDITIVCRISAYWQSIEDLLLLVKSLQQFPRRRILIDFYDRELVSPGKQINFSRNNGHGYWKFIDLEDDTNSEVTISKAKMEVEYSIGELNFQYPATRSFFRKENLLKFFKGHFFQATLHSAESLLTNDPSFTIIIDFSST